MQLREVRDFSQVLSASVSFIKAHFIPLGRALLSIIIPFAIIDQLSGPPDTTLNIPAFLQTSDSLATHFCAFLVTGYVYCYLVLFQERRLIPGPLDIWRLLFRRSFAILIGFILSIIIIVLGLAFVILPGLYLAGIFSLMTMVIVSERKGVFEAFGRCFELVSREWWGTMGIYIITMYFSVIYALGTGLPLEFLVSILEGNSIVTHQVEEVNHLINRANVFITFISSQLLSAIPPVALGIQYYSIVEKREMVGLMDRLATLIPTEQAAE